MAMADIRLTLASKDYDHFRDLKTGAVKPQGIELTCLSLYPTDIFHRQLAFGEFELSELSLCKYASLIAEGNDSFVGLPVFPLRMFRQSAFYVRADSAIRQPQDLIGKRCGIPEWAQTATVYVRGWLERHAGVPLRSIEWVQAGANEAGRAEKVPLKLPEGIRCRTVADRSLNDLLLAGAIDCMISATPPDAARGPNPAIVPMFHDAQAAEEQYFRDTGIFPIMHLIALRKDVHRRYPWAAANLLIAFEEAKSRSVQRLVEPSPLFPLVWSTSYVASTGRLLFGDGEYWPYGLSANRKTLEAFLTYCHEQGICARAIAPEELFAPQVLDRVKH
jgi:4,5-dihydroxyphthalate decarboxylase